MLEIQLILRRFPIRFLNRFIHFAAEDLHITRGVDADPYVVPF
jgi:hypothetical protein